MATTSRLSLFSTSACHLCEQALALVLPLLGEDWELVETDISESDDLFDRYGLSIPVLRREDDGRELNWPFTSEDLGRFLGPGGD